MRILPIPLVAGTLALLAAPADAQNGWSQVATNGPPARLAHGSAYDLQAGQTLVFGGRIATPPFYLGDLWGWDGGTWQLHSSTGPTRQSHAMAYDELRDRTVVFGGWNQASITLGDTWEWDGSAWAMVAASGPPARYSPAMVYDSLRGRMVLFGGELGRPPYFLGDTWAWDGVTWTQISTNGPSPRSGCRLAYDDVRDKVVLFGGWVPLPSNDTWELSHNTWSNRTTNAPPTRYVHAMYFDRTIARTVMFGGQQTNRAALGDTWEWNGSTWSQTAATGPEDRFYASATFDSQRGVGVLFGGDPGPYPIVPFGDTWERVGGGPTNTALAAPYGSGCGTPTLTAQTSSRPILGANAGLQLQGVPGGSPAFVSIGWSDTNAGGIQLPLALVGYGMPGCELLQSAEVVALPTTRLAGSLAQFTFAVPATPGFLALELYLQAWAPAPTANPAGVIVSNGVAWTIGSF
ncbi:MAG: hypothetical protein NXI31_20745 [bacterium]|nr:hypothetical protein [bacterium]